MGDMEPPQNDLQIYSPINKPWQAVFSLEGDIAGGISKNRFRTITFDWSVLWVYKFENRFVGSPYHPSRAPKRTKQNSSFSFYWYRLLCMHKHSVPVPNQLFPKYRYSVPASNRSFLESSSLTFLWVDRLLDMQICSAPSTT